MNKKEYNKDRYDRQRDIILEKVKVYADNNKEKISLTKKIAYQRSKEKRRIYNISKKFGISEEEYQDLMNNQKGCCKICKDSLVFCDSIRGPAVDHNHSTGEVRALLCANCNTALGLFLENKEILQSALDYLKEFNGSSNPSTV